MDYVINARGLPFNGDTIRTRSLGGSESAAYYLARELAARGHRVTVFTSSQEEGSWDGVKYIWHGPITQGSPLGERFDYYAVNTPHDVLIVQRYAEAFAKKYASKVNVWQLHDLGLYRQQAAVAGNLWDIDIVTTVSDWQRKQVAEVYGIDPAIMRVVENGVDPALYDRARHLSDTELCEAAKTVSVGGSDVLTLLYQSRPERGLEHLVRPGGIMDRLAKASAPIHLFYCAYDFTHDGTRAYYAQLDAWGKALPNVTNLGALTKSDLAEVQCNVDVLCYPTEFDEVSCITVMEAMHAHLPVVTSNCAALPETCAGSGAILIDLKNGVADEDAFVSQLETLIADLNDEEREGVSILGQLAETQHTMSYFKTWARATDQLEAAVKEAFSRSQDMGPRLVRHCIEHGDISTLWHFRDMIDSGNEIAEKGLEELDHYYAFTQSLEATREYYAKEQERWVKEVESFITNDDHTPNSARYQGVRTVLAKHFSEISDRKPRVLDFGSAYGHYIVNLGKHFPNATFEGIETSKEVVRMGRAWINRENMTNVEIRVGDQESIAKINSGTYDAVLAGEVVEHVRDWEGLLRELKRVLRPGGVLIISTPVGRHEFNGDDFQRARQHLHHFERQDIVEICNGSKSEIMCAPSAIDKAGQHLGSWVWAVWPNDKFPGVIDMNRKLSQIKPRQTVTACLIAKDAAVGIEKCLLSFIKQVDEIIVGIDPVSTDNTEEVVRRVASRYPFKPLTVFNLRAPVLNTGFSDARNQTIDRASGDWIMWIDADEEVHGAWNFWKFLKTSTHQAFAMPQIHYAIEPPQVLTTDYPARLFSRKSGARFHGLVHEHPEVEQGSSIPNTTMRGEVKFAHYGYVDETTRRRRFSRNYPLLVKDCELNPNRILNKYLMLRDVAQSITFEHQAGIQHQEQFSRAQYGQSLFTGMLEKAPTRMVLDALPYYSMCVQVCGGGFDAEVTLQSSHYAFKELSSTANVKGRFADRKTYLTLINRISEEMTQHYESRYA